MSSSIGSYGALFLASFFAATIFPAQSELGLAALYLSGNFSLVILVIVASVGNTLGSVTNWILGRGVERFRHKPWFPANEVVMARAQAWYSRYGYWSLLLSWVPIIGDPITLAAGVLREPLWRFLLIVTIAKLSRYIVLAFAISQV